MRKTTHHWTDENVSYSTSIWNYISDLCNAIHRKRVADKYWHSVLPGFFIRKKFKILPKDQTFEFGEKFIKYWRRTWVNSWVKTADECARKKKMWSQNFPHRWSDRTKKRFCPFLPLFEGLTLFYSCRLNDVEKFPFRKYALRWDHHFSYRIKCRKGKLEKNWKTFRKMKMVEKIFFRSQDKFLDTKIILLLTKKDKKNQLQI